MTNVYFSVEFRTDQDGIRIDEMENRNILIGIISEKFKIYLQTFGIIHEIRPKPRFGMIHVKMSLPPDSHPECHPISREIQRFGVYDFYDEMLDRQFWYNTQEENTESKLLYITYVPPIIIEDTDVYEEPPIIIEDTDVYEEPPIIIEDTDVYKEPLDIVIEEKDDVVYIDSSVRKIYIDETFDRPLHFCKGESESACQEGCCHIYLSNDNNVQRLLIEAISYGHPIHGLECLKELRILEFHDSTFCYPPATEFLRLPRLQKLSVGYLFVDILTLPETVKVRFCSVAMCQPRGRYNMLLNLVEDAPSRFYTTMNSSVPYRIQLLHLVRVLRQNPDFDEVTARDLSTDLLGSAIQAFLPHLQKKLSSDELLMMLAALQQSGLAKNLRITIPDRQWEQWIKPLQHESAVKLSSITRPLDLPKSVVEHVASYFTPT